MVSALATSAFKLVQGVTTIRMQREDAAAIQAAVWDRLLNLPVNFYRKYSAGDLSDRAEGDRPDPGADVGAGVAAILGSRQRPVLRGPDDRLQRAAWPRSPWR